jgi:hypothetical protein
MKSNVDADRDYISITSPSAFTGRTIFSDRNFQTIKWQED